MEKKVIIYPKVGIELSNYGRLDFGTDREVIKEQMESRGFQLFWKREETIDFYTYLDGHGGVNLHFEGQKLGGIQFGPQLRAFISGYDIDLSNFDVTKSREFIKGLDHTAFFDERADCLVSPGLLISLGDEDDDGLFFNCISVVAPGCSLFDFTPS